jgi:hypothetical protein
VNIKKKESDYMSKYRTHTCGELTIKDLDKKVTLSGFVMSIRDHGGVMFIDLRDHYGVTQIVVHDDSMLKGVSKETVIMVTGKVIKRELITGFLNGLIIAVIAFGLVMGFLLLRNEGMAASLKTALSVSISLIISMSIAAFLGAFVPYVLSKLKVDPAVASGPFITTINDIVAIIIYYSLASLLFTIL